jgi:hypothetical protein
MQYLVVIVEILREASRWEIFYLCIENIWHWESIFLEYIEEEYELVLSLLPIVDVFLQIHQELP